MELLLPVICFSIAILTYLINKRVYQPVFVFSALWGLILLLENFHLGGIYSSREATYWVIALGVVSFSAGSILFRRVARTKGKPTSIYEIRYTAFFVILFVTIALLIYPAINNIKALLSNQITFAMIRATFTNEYKNVVLSLLYNYIALPASMACLPIMAIIVFNEPGKKRTRQLFVLVCIIIVERVVGDAGRGVLLYFLVMLFFSYKIFTDSGLQREKEKRKGGKRKKRRILFITVILLFFGAFIVSAKRSGDSYSMTEQIYTYLCGCIPFLDSNLREVDSSGVYLYGTGGLHGIFQFIFTMLDNVGILSYPDFMQTSDAWYESALAVRTIGKHITFNAYATLFYNIYLDGRIPAIIGEMFLYGACSRVMYNEVLRDKCNLRVRAVLVFILYGLVFSFIRMQFALCRNWIAIFMILILVKKQQTHSSDCLCCKSE